MNNFGWKPTTDDKKISDNARYSWARLREAVPPMGSVEVTFPWNDDWIAPQDQGNIGACVGYGCSWMKSYYDKQLFNAYWLYKRAQAIDGDPGTKGDNDGAYIWAAGDVLRKEGHALYKTTTPSMDYKILSYYWAKSIDEIRTAAASGYPPTFGIPWFSNFNKPWPKASTGELWIGEGAWGNILGGHCIWCCAVSDSRKAVALLNTWGKSYADGGPVWISYASITKLFKYGSECMIALDYIPEPPPDPEPGDDTMTVNAIVDGREYGGTLERVK
jgi:hypothetical protein